MARTRAALALQFEEFAAHCAIVSPLYHVLALRIAGDPALLDLAAATAPGQPPPNMLLGAAHELLLRGVAHPLAAYYPTLGGGRPPDEEVLAAFRDLCFSQRGAVEELLATRRTQTNETRRCAYLLPAFARVAELAGGRPLALIEIGPSAGLNLSWDRYGYDYGDGRLYGDPASPVRVTSELRGPRRPPLPAAMPAVAWRVGAELNPVDLDAPADRRWLEALVWPEHLERVARLRAAIAVARAYRPPIVAGDALALLPGLLAQAPAEAALCVYHTHVTYQFTPEARARLDELLAAAGARRPLARLSCEGFGAEHPRLVLTSYSEAGVVERLLAVTPGHANWIDWQEQDHAGDAGPHSPSGMLPVSSYSRSAATARSNE